MDLYLPLVYSTALIRHLFFHLRGGGGGGVMQRYKSEMFILQKFNRNC